MLPFLQSKTAIPFDYVVVSASIAASGTGVSTLTLSPDSEFELHRYLASSSLDTDTDFMPNNFSVMVTARGTGYQLASANVPQRCFGPYNGLPLLRPILFPRQEVLEFSFTNLDAGSANVITIVLRGMKFYRR